MNLTTERRVLAACEISIAVLALGWVIGHQIHLNTLVSKAAEEGIIVDLNSDPLQRDFRVGLALLLGAIAAWSRKSAAIAVVIALAIYVIAEIIFLLSSPYHIGDVTEPEIQIVSGCLILFAIVLWKHATNNVTIALLAPAYLWINYFFWALSTRHLKVAADVEVLYPPTRLNQLFYGAGWQHVVLFICVTVLALWQGRLIVRGRQNVTEVTS